MASRAIDRLHRLALVLALVLAAAGCVPGLYLVAQDLQTSGEFLDGVGIVFGLALLAPAVVPALFALRALHLLGRQPDRAWRWGLATGVTGVLSITAVSSIGLYIDAVVLTVVVPLLLIVVASASRGSVDPRRADRFGG